MQYEKQHLAKVEERRQQERKEWEQKKKDAVRLKEVQKRYHREKLRYHGIVDTPQTSKTGTVSTSNRSGAKYIAYYNQISPITVDPPSE